MAQDVQSVFTGKTAQQLQQLQKSIEKKLEDRSGGIDITYWESLLSQLKAHLARARLRDKHSENLRRKLEMLKAEQLGGRPGGEESAVGEQEAGDSNQPTKVDAGDREAGMVTNALLLVIHLTFLTNLMVCEGPSVDGLLCRPSGWLVVSHWSIQ